MNRTTVLVHVDISEKVADVINGRVIKLPPNEPVELDSFIANAVMAHIGGIHGVVEVKQTRSKAGVKWEVEEALVRAAHKLEDCDRAVINQYVRTQMEDRIGAGKPALPPSGRALSVILRHKVSLAKEFGLSPVGWKDEGAGAVGMLTSNQAQSNAEVSALKTVVESQKDTIAGLAAELSDLTAKFNELMSVLNAPAETGNETPDEQGNGSEQ
jgi:hypothetical protein